MELVPQISGKWIEPFLGTGVVTFNANFKEAILNDTNPHIINFYKGIQTKEISAPLMKQYLEQEGELLSVADDSGYEHYRKVRSRFNSGEYSPYDFIFLSVQVLTAWWDLITKAIGISLLQKARPFCTGVCNKNHQSSFHSFKNH